MPTPTQVKNTENNLREYRKKYLMKKEFNDLDESATRIMINSFLVDVLNYRELEEIKTEYRIRGAYADYVIQTDRKKQFVVEVKSIQLDLNEKHLRQSINYAANEGIDWVLLVNGKAIELYKVIFEKPISYNKIFEYDLSDIKQLKEASLNIAFLTKQSVIKGELDELWKKRVALSHENLAKILYSEDVAKLLRREIKKKEGLHLQIDEISTALHDLMTNELEAKLKLRKTGNK